MTSASIARAIAAMEAAERLAVEMDDLIEMRERLMKLEAEASATRDAKPKRARKPIKR